MEREEALLTLKDMLEERDETARMLSDRRLEMLLDEAGGDVAAAKRHLFATTWGATLAAASVFLLLGVLFRGGVARLMGDV